MRLVCGLWIAGKAFLMAKGMNIGKKNKDFIIKNNRNHEKLIAICKELLEKYPDRIILPVDSILNPSRRILKTEESVPDDEIMADIGPETANIFRDAIAKAKGIFINGCWKRHKVRSGWKIQEGDAAYV